MSGILWGLLGALCIGASDCIARVTSQRVASSVLFLVIMGVSFAALSLYLLSTQHWPRWHAWAWTASAISGLLNLLALYFLYKALARGPVSVASPAASTFTVLVVLMNILSGEPWSAMQLVSMLVVFVGVGMLARPAAEDDKIAHYNPQWLRTTAFYGLLTAAAVSVRMFLAQEAGSIVGPMHALYLNRVFALAGAVVLVCVLLLRSKSITWPKGSTRHLVLLQAFFETAALGAFLVGSAGGGRIAATIGFSAFAAATTLFAWLWLGEKIGWQRGFWIAVVAGGVCFAVSGS